VELSATGALLEVESILGIPQQFHLRVAGKSSRASPDGKRWRLGRKSDSEAKYSNVNPSRNDRKTVHKLTVKGDVPVDGFWSITVYDAEGRFQKNEYDGYSVNNLTGKKDAGGSIAVQFGGCDGKIPNCLPTRPGWNYMVLLYRPRAEILNGHGNSPAAQPLELGHGRCSEHRVNACMFA
jgi:Protein of unknown function (DUF1214)